MIDAGTTSKWIGNGSSPVCSPTAQISSIAFASWSSSLVTGSDFGGSVLTDGEELLERRVDIFLFLDRDTHKFGSVDLLRVDRHQRPRGIPALFDLAVAEEIADTDELVDQLHAEPVVAEHVV